MTKLHKNTLVLDYETFYDVGYSLTKMSTAAYVNSEDFHVWGVGVKWNDEPTEWISGEDIPTMFEQIPWDA